MASEYVIWPFLNAKGKMMKTGDKAPNETEDNLDVYRGHGLIGTEEEAEEAGGNDVGRNGKAADRKKAADAKAKAVADAKAKAAADAKAKANS